MTLADLQQSHRHLLTECISGSQAYNTNIATSDTDLKGIFVLPLQELYGLSQTPQLANDTNDEVYYEIGRFMELLLKNNPNILELLASPQAAIRYRHPLMDLIHPEDFLSKLCFDTFAGYAQSQVKKAKGLNKKINQTFSEERQSVLDFCYVVAGNGSQPLQAWLSAKGFRQEDCGLVNLDHFRNTYLLYHNNQLPEGQWLRGIASGPDANDVQLSSVPKGILPLTTLHFNKDGYSVYCKDYASYHTWVKERNDARYQSTVAHGQQYDAKNMMHTIRLLTMAEEIATRRQVIVFRPDRDYLLRIRAGAFTYEHLQDIVQEKMQRLETLYAQSDLPDAPDPALAEELLVRIRTAFYAGH